MAFNLPPIFNEPGWEPGGPGSGNQSGGGQIHPPITPQTGGGPGPVTTPIVSPRTPQLGVIDPPATMPIMPASSPTPAGAGGDAVPAVGSIAQWLATPGPFGFTYGQIGLMALGVAVVFNSIGKR